MDRRHILYGVIFLAVFAAGMFNVATDGRFSHAVSSTIPGHAAEASATPEVEVQENLSLIENETGKVYVTVKNADRVSYRDFQPESGLSLEADFRPFPSSVQESLPPYWNWDHPERKIVMELEFNASNTKSGDYVYSVEAWNGDSEASRENISISVR